MLGLKLNHVNKRGHWYFHEIPCNIIVCGPISIYSAHKQCSQPYGLLNHISKTIVSLNLMKCHFIKFDRRFDSFPAWWGPEPTKITAYIWHQSRYFTLIVHGMACDVHMKWEDVVVKSKMTWNSNAYSHSPSPRGYLGNLMWNTSLMYINRLSFMSGILKAIVGAVRCTQEHHTEKFESKLKTF